MRQRSLFTTAFFDFLIKKLKVPTEPVLGAISDSMLFFLPPPRPHLFAGAHEVGQG